jgi:hypothetical protein
MAHCRKEPVDPSGQWIDIVHGRRPPKGIVLDMELMRWGAGCAKGVCSLLTAALLERLATEPHTRLHISVRRNTESTSRYLDRFITAAPEASP